jgi:hypothetical protein
MEELGTKIEEIIEVRDLKKDFRCCKDNFANVCKAKDIGINSFLECLDKRPAKVSLLFAFWIWTFLSVSNFGLYR